MQVGCSWLWVKKNLASSQIPLWIKSLDGYLYEVKDDPVSPNHFGFNAYLENIDCRYRGYIHKVLRNIQSAYRPMESFQDIADLIDSKSATSGEDGPTKSVSTE